MPNPSGSEPVPTGKASSFLAGLPRPEPKQILRLLFHFAEHPDQLGDYATRGEDGREIQHLMVGDWPFSFSADHAVRELRVTAVDEL